MERVKPGMFEYTFWAFLLVTVGRIGELLPGMGSVPLGKIALGCCILCLIANWKHFPPSSRKTVPLMRAVKSLFWIALLLTPFSFWKGGSDNFILNELPALVAVIFVAYKMNRSWLCIRGTLLTLVICGIALAWSALSIYHGGRAATDTMYDTNDLAYLLVTIFPLAVCFAVTAPKVSRRMFYWGVTAILGAASLLTESRGGLLGMSVELALFLFLGLGPYKPGVARKNLGIKLASVLAAGLVVTVVWFHLPDDARVRYETMLNLGDDYNLDASDVTGRRQIWTRGFEAALKRPIGYGPHTFNMVDLKLGGHFMAPHNSFIQILVELGVLGLILFVATYWRALRGLQGARAVLIERFSSLDGEQEQIAFTRALQYSLAGNAVAGFFLSMAYSTLLWTLIGTCMAVISAADRSTVGSESAAISAGTPVRSGAAGGR
jgi:hypothetical protein